MALLAPKEPAVFEQGDHVYLIAPVTPSSPTDAEIEEFAFGKSVVEQARRLAPNEHLGWFGGHYVEADIPNANGAMWRSGELAIKSLTPMLMPVSVMHDPSSAVGLIADTKLLLPEKDGVPRSKIETALAIWKHRFPEVYEEAMHNYQQGTLMQSMEAFSPAYDCSVCGMTYQKLPNGAEREQWCDHLRAGNPVLPGVTADAAAAGGTSNGSRILRNVVFTGTGLIFGTRGAFGADASAYLESFHEEVAGHLQDVHRETASASGPRSHSTMATIQIEQSEYDRLKSERDEHARRATEAETAKATAEKATETAEAAKVKAETEKADAEKKIKDFEEAARAGTLATERLGKLGSAFTEKVASMPTVKARLDEQAKSLSDEDWTARLEEVAEMTGVKPDAVKEEKGGDKGGSGGEPANKGGTDDETAADHGQTLFSREEVASSQAATGGSGGEAGSSGEPQTAASRRSVVAGLTRPAKTEAKK